MTLSVNSIVKWIIDSLFLPFEYDHDRLISIPLLLLVGLIVLLLVVLSLPVMQEFVWNFAFSEDQLNSFYAGREIYKSWFDSLAFILDILVAVFVGGSIFAERLAVYLKESVTRYEIATKATIGSSATDMKESLDRSIQNSIDQINRMRSMNAWEMITNIPKLIEEVQRIYNLAFSGVPNLYKGYIRFLFFSNFPGGLYGFLAFTFFSISSSCKLVSMYLGGPYLAILVT